MPIAPDVVLGEGVTIHHPTLVNLYGCRIGDETKIGTFVEIQKNAVIGRRCKISSHTFICEGVTILCGVTIGEDAMIGAGAVVTRDVAPGETVAGVPARVMLRGAGAGQ